MYLWRSIGACSCNHCCSGEAISITYSDCVFISLCIQHVAYFMCNLLPVWVYSIFFALFHKRHLFSENVSQQKICVLILSSNFVRNISNSKKNWAGCDQKCILVFIESTRYSCPILMKLEFSPQNFERYSNVKFREDLPSGSRFDPYGGTDGQIWLN